MLETLVQKKKTISFDGCMAQLFFFTLSAATELVLLTIMSNDQYLAICHPLRPSLIQHFFCEVPTMLSVSCSSAYLNVHGRHLPGHHELPADHRVL
ncbi:unnamed protein product [Caretta caretta]